MQSGSCSPVLHKPKPMRPLNCLKVTPIGRLANVASDALSFRRAASTNLDLNPTLRASPSPALSLESLVSFGSALDDEARLREIAFVEQELSSPSGRVSFNGPNPCNCESDLQAYGPTSAGQFSISPATCPSPKRPQNPMVNDPSFLEASCIGPTYNTSLNQKVDSAHVGTESEQYHPKGEPQYMHKARREEEGASSEETDKCKGKDEEDEIRQNRGYASDCSTPEDVGQ